MDTDRIVKLIALYKESHPLAGLAILQQIEKSMPADCDVLKEGNCCTFRELISELLFN